MSGYGVAQIGKAMDMSLSAVRRVADQGPPALDARVTIARKTCRNTLKRLNPRPEFRWPLKSRAASIERANRPAPAPGQDVSALDDRPEDPLQRPDMAESAPGNERTRGRRVRCRGRGVRAAVSGEGQTTGRSATLDIPAVPAQCLRVGNNT